MRDWTLLKERLPELKLSRELRSVAKLLVEGRTTEEIATTRSCSRQQVKLAIAAILYHLWRLPPDGSVPATIPRQPQPSPLLPGCALPLPRH